MGNVDACQQLKNIVIPDKATSMATLQAVCCVKLVDFQVALLQHGVMLRKNCLLSLALSHRAVVLLTPLMVREWFINHQYCHG